MLAVGAPFSDLDGDNAGVVYVYDLLEGADSRTSPKLTIHNPTPEANDRFGMQVSFVGGNVLVAAQDDDTDANNAGAAYLFDARTGELLWTYENPDPDPNDMFSGGISAFGEDVLIAAPNDDAEAPEGGALYLVRGVQQQLEQTTLEDGTFRFSGVAPGTYLLSEIAQNGWTQTHPGDGSAILHAQVDEGTYILTVGTDDFAGLDFGNTPSPTVVGRHFIYNRSAFDDNDSTANADDDLAIAAGKEALLPGETATSANYTSYSRGINGIMVDIGGLPQGTVLTADDFEFRVGNDNDPTGWPPAPAPAEVTVREDAGAGGSGRVTIIWRDNAIEKQWLQVTVKATANTGLLQDDVSYFGNAIGECGDSPVHAYVTATDQILARNNPHFFFDPAPIDDHCDYDRDTNVTATDQIIARNNMTFFFDSLTLLDLSGDEGASMAAMDDPASNAVDRLLMTYWQ